MSSLIKFVTLVTVGFLLCNLSVTCAQFQNQMTRDEKMREQKKLVASIYIKPACATCLGICALTQYHAHPWCALSACCLGAVCCKSTQTDNNKLRKLYIHGWPPENDHKA